MVRKAFLLALAWALPSLAAAQFYIGGSVGANFPRFGSEYDRAGATGISASTDDTALAAKVFAGYDLLSWLAIEGGYAYLGKPQVDYQSAGKRASIQVEQQAGFLAAKASWPVTRELGLFGKLGATRNQASTGLSVSTAPSLGTRDTEDRTSLLWGLGAELRYTPHVSFRVEYEDFGEMGKSTRGRLLSAGVVARY